MWPRRLPSAPAVLIAGPLGLCFLPAFVCLGIVPVVAGWPVTYCSRACCDSADEHYT